MADPVFMLGLWRESEPVADGPQATEDAARVLGLLYLTGASLGLASILLPSARGTNLGALAVNIALSYVCGLGLFVFLRSAPRWTCHAALLGGILIITRAVYYSGGAASYYSVWYVWVGLFAFYFFTRRQALGHVAAVAVAYAVVLRLHHDPAGAARWLTTIGTLLVAGIFIDALLSRVRKETAERAALLTRLEQVAHTDELTGLPNLRAWRDELPRSMAAAREEQRPLCVAMIDLDGFKTLNDSRGHQAGDQALKHLAASWQSALRDSDILARYGGDEFLVLLPGCDLDNARQVIDRLTMATPSGLGFSVGVTVWDGRSDSAALMAEADRELYAAKRALHGRPVAGRPASAAA
jgi:diguanylate cyclase (GGDEF)-like protein